MISLHNLGYTAICNSSVFFSFNLFGVIPGLIRILKAPLIPGHVSLLVASVTSNIAGSLGFRIRLRG